MDIAHSVLVASALTESDCWSAAMSAGSWRSVRENTRVTSPPQLRPLSGLARTVARWRSNREAITDAGYLLYASYPEFSPFFCGGRKEKKRASTGIAGDYLLLLAIPR